MRSNLRKRGYAPELIDKSVAELVRACSDAGKKLYYLNKDVYRLLRYGASVKPNVADKFQTVLLIDWKNPLSNDFAFAEEVSVSGENRKRPDVVLYVNGIAVGVLELKRSTVSVAEGIRQNLDNQQNRFIKPFLAAMQLIIAGNDTESLRYGTIKTPEKYYLTWKEHQSEDAPTLDVHLRHLCGKNDFWKSFTISSPLTAALKNSVGTISISACRKRKNSCAGAKAESFGTRKVAANL